MVFDFLLNLVFSLLDETVFEPPFEFCVTLFFLHFFFHSLFFLALKLRLFLDGFLDKFALLPLVHSAGAFLVFEVEFGLFSEELFVEVFFSFVDQKPLQFFLVLFQAEPLVLGHGFGQRRFTFYFEHLFVLS